MNAFTFDASISFGEGSIAKPFRSNMAPLCPSRSGDTSSGPRRSRAPAAGERHVERFVDLLWNGIGGGKP